jgi:DNA-binding protein YbaB
MVNEANLDALGGSLRRVAEDLQRSGEQLQRAIESAQARSYEASSHDGLIEVAVDGRNRVTALWLSPRLSRDQDEMDSLLTATLNDALAKARTGTQQALFDALPVQVRRDVEQTIDDASRENRR